MVLAEDLTPKTTPTAKPALHAVAARAGERIATANIASAVAALSAPPHKVSPRALNAALSTLARSGTPRAVQELSHVAKAHPHAKIRTAAIAALAHVKSAAAGAALIELLGSATEDLELQSNVGAVIAARLTDEADLAALRLAQKLIQEGSATLKLAMLDRCSSTALLRTALHGSQPLQVQIAAAARLVTVATGATPAGVARESVLALITNPLAAPELRERTLKLMSAALQRYDSDFAAACRLISDKEKDAPLSLKHLARGYLNIAKAA